MLWRDVFQLVLRSITSSPLRSLLTALGIAIGIAAVAMLTSIGEGVRTYVLDNFSQFGTRIIGVHPGKTATQGMGGIFRTDRPLTLDDAEALARLPHVEYVVPVVQGAGNIEAGERSRSSDIIGANHAFRDIARFFETIRYLHLVPQFLRTADGGHNPGGTGTWHAVPAQPCSWSRSAARPGRWCPTA